MRRIGPFSFEPETGALIDPQGKRCSLRAQQRRLLPMFLDAPDHRLSVAEIADTFWRGKKLTENNVNGLVCALKGHFGPFRDQFFPRAAKGHYELRLPPEDSPGGLLSEDSRILSRDALLDTQQTGRSSPVVFQPRTEVVIYSRNPEELIRPNQLWGSLAEGVSYHLYFGREPEQAAIAVCFLDALHRAAQLGDTPTKIWEQGATNLRLRFLNERQPPYDLVLFNTQDSQHMTAYLRQPHETEYRRCEHASAAAYWRWLDGSPVEHRWSRLWVGPGLDSLEVAANFRKFAEGTPTLPQWTWRTLVASYLRKQPRKERSAKFLSRKSR